MRAGDRALRRATIEVTYDAHDMTDIDWAYHLRMGGIDADEALVVGEGATWDGFESFMAMTEDEQCVAVCFMRDDHWGRVPQRCELPHGHEGWHSSGMRACEPNAVLVWPHQAAVPE